MKKRTLLLCTAILWTAPLLAEQEHHHLHAGGVDVLAMLVLNDDAKWPVDAVLSAAMLELRAELMQHLDAIHHHRFTGQEYQQFAAFVAQQIQQIVANCELTPEADAQFHLVLAAMMQGQKQLAQNDVATQRQGAVQLLRALQQYPQYFADPAFAAIVH